MLRSIPFPTVITLSLVALALGAVTALARSFETRPQPPSEPEPYVIWAGSSTPDLSGVQFYPQRLQVHRGATVTWEFYGPHNVHFRPSGGGLGFPSFEANIDDGARYQGGDANSGIFQESQDPAAPATFSLVIDLEPGSYTYICDLHRGMFGVIEVVADDVEIMTPEEVAAARLDLEANIAASAGGQAHQH